MGVTKEQAQKQVARHDKKQSNVDWGSVAGAKTGAGVDWGDADPSLCNSLVYHATRRGMAVSFSATANGQGVSITILDGGQRPKWYANTPDELNTLIETLTDFVRAAE